MDLTFGPAPESPVGHTLNPIASLESILGPNQLTTLSDYYVTGTMLGTWQETIQV